MPAERNRALDIVRGFAFVFMLLAHFRVPLLWALGCFAFPGFAFSAGAALVASGRYDKLISSKNRFADFISIFERALSLVVVDVSLSLIVLLFQGQTPLSFLSLMDILAYIGMWWFFTSVIILFLRPNLIFSVAIILLWAAMVHFLNGKISIRVLPLLSFVPASMAGVLVARNILVLKQNFRTFLMTSFLLIAVSAPFIDRTFFGLNDIRPHFPDIIVFIAIYSVLLVWLYSYIDYLKIFKIESLWKRVEIFGQYALWGYILQYPIWKFVTKYLNPHGWFGMPIWLKYTISIGLFFGFAFLFSWIAPRVELFRKVRIDRLIRISKWL